MNASPAQQSAESMSDEQLVALAQQEDEEAFVLLVSRCLPLFKRLAQKYGNACVDSEDLVQEGLVSLLSAVRTYRGNEDSSFRTYAYACARNRMISVLRHNGTKVQIPLDRDEPLECISDGRGDPAQLMQQREELSALYKRIGAVLTQKEYTVLKWYLASYSYREIASLLNIEVKAVDNALQRLRRKLANAAVF